MAHFKKIFKPKTLPNSDKYNETIDILINKTQKSGKPIVTSGAKSEYKSYHIIKIRENPLNNFRYCGCIKRIHIKKPGSLPPDNEEGSTQTESSLILIESHSLA